MPGSAVPDASASRHLRVPRAARLRHMGRALAVAALLALFVTPAGLAKDRSPLHQPFGSAQQLTKAKVTAAFLAEDKVAHWLDRYPRAGRVTEAAYDKKTRSWTIKVWWGKAGEIATGQVDDGSGLVTEAWTGPQVAWKMARGYSGAFGGEVINNTWVWLGLCAAFLLGLGNLRRPLSLRNLDLIALLSFSVSLWSFKKKNIFTSVPLAYPPLFYLLGRLIWIATASPDRRQRRGPSQRDRRRVLGGDRRRADRARSVAVRAHAGRGLAQALRALRRERRDPRPDSDQRTLRVGQRARGHLRPGVLRGLPTCLRRLRLEREMGQPPRWARDLDPLGHPLPARARAHGIALRRDEARGHARLRVGRVSVHAVRLQLEHE